MKSTFEEMGGTYRQEGDYLLPNLELPEQPEDLSCMKQVTGKLNHTLMEIYIKCYGIVTGLSGLMSIYRFLQSNFFYDFHNHSFMVISPYKLM